MANDDLLDLLSRSRVQIIPMLKQRGPITADDAVEYLDLAETTIRQHLAAWSTLDFSTPIPSRTPHRLRVTPLKRILTFLY